MSAATHGEISRDAEADRQNVSEAAAAVFANGREVVDDFVKLVALETRLAVSSISRILILAVATGVCAVSAWLGVLLSVALTLRSMGLPPLISVIGVTLVLLGSAFAAYLLIRRTLGNLTFEATRSAISPAGNQAGDGKSDQAMPGARRDESATHAPA